MHFLSFILAIPVLVGATPSFPPLRYIGALHINITAGQQIPVNEGTRVLNSYLGLVCNRKSRALLSSHRFVAFSGYATDESNKTIAHIVPGEGGEAGLIDTKGIFHPSTRGVLKFDVEDAYAFFTMQGVKNGSEFLYV